MGATHPAVLPTTGPRSVPDRSSLPRSFQEAVKLGWTVSREESAIDIRQRQRKGTVLMKLKGFPLRLRIPYTATRKEWQFGTPEPVE
jgi:hypothetical protein